MSIAVVPGSFDPITLGHLDIIHRASELFDEVIVGVSTNSGKNPLFSIEERIVLVRQCLEENPRIKVMQMGGLLVNFAESNGAVAIVKGLRAVTDFDYELQMALMNRRLSDKIETVFLMANSDYSFLSSSIVKEVARLGGSVEGLVTDIVRERLIQKLK